MHTVQLPWELHSLLNPRNAMSWAHMPADCKTREVTMSWELLTGGWPYSSANFATALKNFIPVPGVRFRLNFLIWPYEFGVFWGRNKLTYTIVLRETQQKLHLLQARKETKTHPRKNSWPGMFWIWNFCRVIVSNWTEISTVLPNHQPRAVWAPQV